MILRDIEVEFKLTPKELALEWCEMNSEEQAIFFNTLAEKTAKWCTPLSFQLHNVAHESILTCEARRVMDKIGEYAYEGEEGRGNES